MTRHPMNRRDFGLLTMGTLGAVMIAKPAAQNAWTSLWNGTDLAGWTTWMRQPEPTSEVPGLKRSADGRYTEPIGSGLDPLKVFTVARDVDGGPAIRISGEVFGELRTTSGATKNGRPVTAEARRATAGCSTMFTPRLEPRDVPGRARSSCRSRNTMSAISMPLGRRSPFGQNAAPARSLRYTTTIRPASGHSFRKARAHPVAASNNQTTKSPRVSGTLSSWFVSAEIASIS
jgi:hypothetical protein